MTTILEESDDDYANGDIINELVTIREQPSSFDTGFRKRNMFSANVLEMEQDEIESLFNSINQHITDFKKEEADIYSI
jgi:hypothetical protein